MCSPPWIREAPIVLTKRIRQKCTVTVLGVPYFLSPRNQPSYNKRDCLETAMPWQTTGREHGQGEAEYQAREYEAILPVQPSGGASDDSSPRCRLTITTWETPSKNNLGGPRQPREPWEIIINSYFKTLNFEVACQEGISPEYLVSHSDLKCGRRKTDYRHRGRWPSP